MVRPPGDKILRREIDHERLKKIRQQQGLSLWDLSLKIHKKHGFWIFPQNLSAYERGKAYPTQKRLEMWTDTLGYPAEEFYV